MSKYVCLNCNKDFKQKTNFLNHTKYKKNPCVKTNSYEDNISIPTQENNIPIINFSKKPKEEKKSNYDNVFKKLYCDTEKTMIKCNDCEKFFTRKDNLKVHMKKYCKKRNIYAEVVKNKVSIEEYQQIVEQNDKLIKMLNQCQEIIKQNSLVK